MATFYASDFHAPKAVGGTASVTWYDSLLPFYKIGLRESDVLDMVFGEWWGLSKALAKDKQQEVKNMAIAMRVAQADSKGWKEFMKD